MRRSRSRLGFALLALIPFSAAVAGSPASLPEQFDAERAMAHVRKQVEFGPRPSGSEALKKTREYLAGELKSAGLEVRQSEFESATPRGQVRFVNIQAALPAGSSALAVFAGKRSRILLASHYDTKWMPDIRFVGANDGASSTAVLLEVARVVAANRFRPNKSDLEFVLFDGEEAVKEYSDTDGLYGSRRYVREAREAKALAGIRAMILMDMVGDRDLSVQIPAGDMSLARKVFDASKSLGYRESFHLMETGMIDDHTPFLDEKIPSIDLIDFNYGRGNRWWHTAEDTVDKISPDSLKIIGQTVLRLLETW
jgi:Zn-dependent M28 family amino/carboxypeptidase